MKYYIVDAFTDQPFGGNPAGVVLLDSNAFPEEGLMLHIAAELRYSETAFIQRHSDNEFTIRYFTPKAEVDLCGHATIASFFMLHQKGLASGQCLCHTKSWRLAHRSGRKSDDADGPTPNRCNDWRNSRNLSSSGRERLPSDNACAWSPHE